MSSHSSKERHEHSSQAPSCSYIHNQLSGMLSFGLPKRYMRLVFAVIFSIAIWCSAQKYIGAQSATGATSVAINVPFPQVQEVADSELPPLFESYRQYEDDVSEQNIDIQNNTQRYIFFANQAHGCGWGNVLQEIVFNALLASEANLGSVNDIVLTLNNAQSILSDMSGMIIHGVERANTPCLTGERYHHESQYLLCLLVWIARL